MDLITDVAIVIWTQNRNALAMVAIGLMMEVANPFVTDTMAFHQVAAVAAVMAMAVTKTAAVPVVLMNATKICARRKVRYGLIPMSLHLGAAIEQNAKKKIFVERSFPVPNVIGLRINCRNPCKCNK